LAFAALGALLASLSFDLAGAAEPMSYGDKVALVIGNGAYQNAPLRNPVNDANAVALAFKALGFQVYHHDNATHQEMIEALRRFSQSASRSEVRLLYFAGHGIQIKGRNYLLPVDADVKSEQEVLQRSIDITELLEQLATIKGGINLVILDACRINPFNQTPSQLVDARGYKTRSLAARSLGLAAVQAPSGTIVAFSTSPGSVATDSSLRSNSIYTRHLLSHLNVPGLPVEKLFKLVRTAVAAETQQMQVPWESSSLLGEYCFRTDASGKCSG
jgi:carboxyl-terminal processing protease